MCVLDRVHSRTYMYERKLIVVGFQQQLLRVMAVGSRRRREQRGIRKFTRAPPRPARRAQAGRASGSALASLVCSNGITRATNKSVRDTATEIHNAQMNLC